MLETARLEYLEKRSRSIRILFWICVPALAILLFFLDTDVVIATAIISPLIAYVIYAFAHDAMAAKSFERYCNGYKNIIGDVVAVIDPGLAFNKRQGIDYCCFESSELYRHQIDRYGSEDLVFGKYGKTQLKIAEIYAEQKMEQLVIDPEDMLESPRYQKVFQGLLLVADFHKHFDGKTFVLPNGSNRNPGTTAVHLEDTEFETKFSVFSSCLLYTSPSPRDKRQSRMPSSA